MENINNKHLTHSVKELFENYLQENNVLYYNIPDYQRGYKWTAKNVEELLNDIHAFCQSVANSENCDKFYCLQNITICSSQDSQGNRVYNVVDGQQRLTTLTILLSYLEVSALVQNKIKYSIREDTHRFISEQIITREIWKQKPDIKHKDQYYLYEVAQSIKKWFEPQDASKRFSDDELKQYTAIILKNVHLIVNDLESDEEQIFAKLNGAKVNLDGADLLRAILMTHSSKEKFANDASLSQINEFRIQMGIEIDEINRWWGQEEVKSYFKQMISAETVKSAKRNRFDTDMFPINILYILIYEINRKKNDDMKFSFRFFEYGLDKDNEPGNDNWELYAELRKLHLEMQDWFNDPETYHYLGYLFFRCKSKNRFSEIYDLWREADSKSAFKQKLKERIITSLVSKYQKDEDKNEKQLSKEELCKELYKEIIDTNQNWYENNNDLFNCLILQDIITILNNISGSLTRLPAKYFTNQNEDKEHIGCQTPNEQDRKNKSKWLTCIEDIKKQYPEVDDEAMQKILIDDTVSEEQQNKLINKLNQYGLNSIGNIVLLDLRINRSYGNSSYSDKRMEIINNFYQGRFIRNHTFRVFIKAGFPDQSNLQQWTYENIKNNALYIANNLVVWSLSTENMSMTEKKGLETLVKNWNK